MCRQPDCATTAGTLQTTLLIARYGIVEGVHHRLFWLAALLLLLAVAVSSFVGGLLLVEQDSTTVALLAVLLRSTLLILLAILVVGSCWRFRQEGMTEWLWSLSVGRSCIYFGRLLGFVAIAFALGIVAAGLLLFFVPPWNVLFWVAGLLCELSLIVALAMLFGSSFRSLTNALVLLFCFYFLARSMDTLLLLSSDPLQADRGLISSVAQMIEWLSLLFPRFSQLAQAQWLLYPPAALAVLWPLLLHSLLYFLLVVAVSLFDFHRQEL